MNTLGKRIAIAREKLGLNQSELARRLNVTPQAVQKWEVDNSKPREKAKELDFFAGNKEKERTQKAA